MDNLTHTLTGIALSQAGLNRKTRFATLALVLASNAPDVDVLAGTRGSVGYLEYHRGLTHSVIGVTGLAVFLAAAIYSAGRKWKPKPAGPPLNARWLLAACWMGTAGHLLLDFTNQYGVRPFLPFSSRWYAWDIMPIFDPVLWLILALGLGLPFLLRLVSEEVGAHRPGYRRGAVMALVGMLLLWGLRDFNHRRVLAELAANNYGQEPPLRLGAFPTLNPFVWRGVVETDSTYYVLPASALSSDVDAADAEPFRKPESSPALETAMKSQVGRVFMNFVRFPWAQVDENEEGFEVRIRDLRFGGFEATIDLDHNLAVTGQSFSFSGRSRR
ncbi:MAG TPA: metal-dependent hydrolase [Terriglobia bacterium]|nr:metal-dependent hydrolase [Terriglobia bacterium]